MMKSKFKFSTFKMINLNKSGFEFDYLLYFLLSLSLDGIELQFYELSWIESVKLLKEGLSIEDYDFRETDFIK